MRTLTRGTRALVAASAAALLGLGWGAAPASAAGPYEDKTVFVEGHADLLFASDDDGKTRLQVHDDTTSPPSYASPDDYVFHVKPSVAGRTANAFIASIEGFSEIGETIYVLPQTNIPGTIFAGFGHSLPAGSTVEYTLSGYEGPGRFAAWQADAEGPRVFLNQAAGLPASFSSHANHEHLAWGFTAEGEYRLTFTAQATLPGGETLEVSDEQIYTFYVGEELPTGGTIGDTTLSIEGLAGHYHAGGIVQLTATQEPDTGLDHFHWFTRAPGESDWTVVPGAHTGSYGFIALTEHNGLEVIARLYDHDHNQVAESAPVTVVVDDHGNSPVEGPTISATLGESTGALVVSVDADARDVRLSDFELTAEADRYVASGDLDGIRVTDTRSANPGWNVNGRVRSFTTVDANTLGGNHLGWAPTVLSQSEGQSVQAGAQVASVLSGGSGLSGWTTLASSAAGQGKGAAELGAGLTLEAPPTLVPGTYQGLLILTAI